MEALKVIGQEKIGKIEFTGIEGGFGEGKKAMLAKDIATIHNQPVGNINRIVNNNRKWFEDGIDVIDLKTNASDASVLQKIILLLEKQIFFIRLRCQLNQIVLNSNY